MAKNLISYFVKMIKVNNYGEAPEEDRQEGSETFIYVKNNENTENPNISGLYLGKTPLYATDVDYNIALQEIIAKQDELIKDISGGV